MLSFRPLDFGRDRDFFLDLHCLANFSGDQAWFRGESYEVYRETWLATAQPAGAMQMVQSAMDESRAVAEIWEDDGEPVGLLVLIFTDVEDYGLTIAEVMDIAVVPARQRGGIATAMLGHAEAIARERGADLLRADIGASNVASRALHEKAGFEPFRINYEKRLT